MTRGRTTTLLAAALLAVSTAAGAQDAYTARAANLRAGPDRSYPLVERLGPGTPVQINGCLSDWSWCDVGFDDTRGWIYAPLLDYVYQDSRVPLYTYAPTFGIPIVTFSLGTYWDRYYRGRPWYPERGEWEHRRIPHRRPAGPPPRAGVPPHFGAPAHAGPPPRGPSRNEGPGRNQGPGPHQAPFRGGRAAPENAPGRGAGPGRSAGHSRQGPGEHESRAAPPRVPHQERGREARPQSAPPGHGDHGRGGERPPQS